MSDNTLKRKPDNVVALPKLSILTDIVVLLSCIIGFGLCLLLFWNDLNMTLSRMGETPIGTVSFRYNTAQRRFIDRVIWDRLRNDSPVYNGDVIRTADLSEATIVFTGGGSIELFSNTLVQVFADKIEFSQGSLSVSSASDTAMTISQGNNLLNIDSDTVLQMAALRNGSFDLTVNRGSAFIENLISANQQLSVAAGEAVRLDTAGETVRRPVAAAILPLSGSRFLNQSSSNNMEIEFVWNKINYTEDGQTRLEVSADRSFGRISFTALTPDNRLSISLPEGTWFWRAVPVGSSVNNEEIQYSRITIVRSAVPALKNPTQEQVIYYRDRPPSLRFQWTASAESSFYILEAANNRFFDNPVLRQQVRSIDSRDISINSSALGEGIWYWRVTPVYPNNFIIQGDGAEQVSLTGSFMIVRGADLGAPVLTSPLENAILNVETGRRDILFSWRRENEAVSYTFRVSANRNMSSPIMERTVTDTFFRYGVNETSITPGAWYWSVSQKGADGAESPMSAPRIFIAMHGEVIQRAVFPPDNYIIAENLLPDMRFTWKTNLMNTRFQLSRTADFSSLVLNESASAEAYTVSNLRSGQYYWRITGGSGASSFQSQPRRFFVAEALSPPVLSQPQSGVSSGQAGRVIIQYGEPIKFNWVPTEGAQYYSFKLFREGSQVPIMETLVYDTEFSINMDDYSDGSYTWTVQGFASDSAMNSRRIGLTATQTTIFRHVKPVVIEHPAGGFVYEGLAASRRPDTAIWSSAEVPYNVSFVIARNVQMTDIVYEGRDIQRAFTLPRLAAGDYYWMINAVTTEGFDISTRSPSHFRVLPIPLLPAPQNRTPADGYTFGPTQARESRSISFSWSSVPGANGYIVTISQGTGTARRSMFESSVQTQTRFTLDDLRPIGRGTFTWQVEAVFVDDGFIEQRGVTQDHRIIIDIPSPAPAQTRDQGTLYGQ